MEEIISIKEFKNMPDGKSENRLLEYFKENKDKAFKIDYINNNFDMSRSMIYSSIRTLILAKLIEKKGDYYAFLGEKE